MVPPKFQRPTRHAWSGAQSRSPVVDLKVKWADHHRGLLHTAIDGFRDRKPYFVHEDRQSHEGVEYRVLNARPETAPDEIGLILGDFIQNLRASLDYLVGAMRPDGASRNSQFPILLERPRGPHGFKNRCCVMIDQIPDDALKLIHWMRPYHGAARDPGRMLSALEVLWNIAKHRTLLVVTAATPPDYVWRERSGDEAQGIGFRMAAPDHSSDIWLPITEPQEHFEPYFTVQVTLAKPRGFARDWPTWIDDWEVEGLVDYLYQVVAFEVVPRFNEFVQLES